MPPLCLCRWFLVVCDTAVGGHRKAVDGSSRAVAGDLRTTQTETPALSQVPGAVANSEGCACEMWVGTEGGRDEVTSTARTPSQRTMRERMGETRHWLRQSAFTHQYHGLTSMGNVPPYRHSLTGTLSNRTPPAVDPINLSFSLSLQGSDANCVSCPRSSKPVDPTGVHAST